MGIDLKEFNQDNWKVIFEQEGVYEVDRFYFNDVFHYSKNKDEVKWKLVRYEKVRSSNNDIRYMINATVNNDGNYSEIIMSIKNLLTRRINLNSEGRVLADYITDSFLNSMNCKVYVAVGSPFDYQKQSPGPSIDEYLDSEHEFVNTEDSDDLYQNRWLLDEFFKEYLKYDESKYFKRELGYLDYPKQKILK